MTKVDELLIEGKVKEAIEIMCDLPEYEKEREQYIDLFENEHYRQYEVDGILNEILLAYQQYFRDVFYCNSDEEIAADKLIRKLCQTFSISEKEKDALEDRLQELFEQKGYHALFGKTQGYFGPYIWKDTVPTSYQIELPEGVEQYTVKVQTTTKQMAVNQGESYELQVNAGNLKKGQAKIVTVNVTPEEMEIQNASSFETEDALKEGADGVTLLKYQPKKGVIVLKLTGSLERGESYETYQSIPVEAKITGKTTVEITLTEEGK